MRLLLLGATVVLLRSAAAVFTDEAWNVDYQHLLLGLPKEDTTFFHQPDPSSKASLIYTLSENGVIGAVNPRDGGVVWRQVLLSNGTTSDASFLRAGDSQDFVISGIGHQVAAWSAGDGRQVWDLDLPGPVEDLEILELIDGKETPSAKDGVLLVGGNSPVVYRVDGATGAVKWQHKLDGGDTPYQVSASTTQVFAIVLHKTILGYIKIKVISLDPVDGHKTDEFNLSSDSELASADTIVAVGANSASPIIAWTDAAHSVLKINIIGTKAVASFTIEKDGEQAVQRVRLHAPYRSNSLAHFLVQYQTATSHWADVYHIDVASGKIVKAYSLPKLSGKGTFSTTTSDANVYFTRITSNEVTTVSSASHGVLGRWPVNGFAVAASLDDQIDPLSAVSEVSVKGDVVSAVRSAVLLSTGDWILLRDGSPIWQRAEVLSDATAAIFASPHVIAPSAQQLEFEAHRNPIQAYLHRVTRHIKDLKFLPAFLQTLPQGVIAGFLGTSADNIASDTFGFHQAVICATRKGRLIAIDAGRPDRILWNRQVNDVEVGGTWTPELFSPVSGVVSVFPDAAGEVQSFNVSTGESLPFGRLPSSEHPSQSSRSVEYTIHDGSLEAKMGGSTAWHFAPLGGERIVSLVPRPVDDPVASIGKVLGDRRVLYKYLDPNSALLVTAKDSSRSATVYILNTVSGAIMYSNTHTGVDLSAPIASILSENWFAYSLAAEPIDPSPKGYLLVVGELFESLVANDRGPLSASTNFSSIDSSNEPFVLTHTYQIPEAISKMAVTRTRQGITSRQLLAVLPDSNAIIGIPYGVLDPRRPINRDPTKDEQAEGLSRYSPVIEFEPKWLLNHQREVVGVQNVITSPALIESTSLVFAYGLDIFGTRLSPSFSFDILGKDFNKFQMLATVAALAVATFIVAPLVTQKQINTRWQFL